MRWLLSDNLAASLLFSSLYGPDFDAVSPSFPYSSSSSSRFAVPPLSLLSSCMRFCRSHARPHCYVSSNKPPPSGSLCRSTSKRGESFGISRIGSKIKGVFKSTTMEGAMLPSYGLVEGEDDMVSCKKIYPSCLWSLLNTSTNSVNSSFTFRLNIKLYVLLLF